MKSITVAKNINIIEKTNIKSELYHVTTGVRSIEDFKNGFYWWSCGDGQDIKMTDKEINYINEELKK